MLMVLMMMSDSDVVMMMVMAAVMINADHFFLSFQLVKLDCMSVYWNSCSPLLDGLDREQILVCSLLSCT